LPDNTEIGIEDEDVVAMVGTKAHFFTVGQLSDEAANGSIEAFITRRENMIDPALKPSLCLVHISIIVNDLLNRDSRGLRIAP
jgi:hypothetical protein